MPRLPTLILFADSIVLALVLVLGSPALALRVAVPAGLVAAVACELNARRERHERVSTEPWRLDGWCVTIAAFAVLGLGLSLGTGASGSVWLLVALVAGLAFASLPPWVPRPHA